MRGQTFTPPPMILDLERDAIARIAAHFARRAAIDEAICFLEPWGNIQFWTARHFARTTEPDIRDLIRRAQTEEFLPWLWG
jgi:hypothetical protein